MKSVCVSYSTCSVSLIMSPEKLYVSQSHKLRDQMYVLHSDLLHPPTSFLIIWAQHVSTQNFKKV